MLTRKYENTETQIVRQARGMRRRRRMRSPEGLFPPGRNQDGEIESFAARPSTAGSSGCPRFPAGSCKFRRLHDRRRCMVAAGRVLRPLESVCRRESSGAERGRCILNRHALNPQQDSEVIVIVLHGDRSQRHSAAVPEEIHIGVRRGLSQATLGKCQCHVSQPGTLQEGRDTPVYRLI